MDNLNTHTLGSLYEAFEPAKARALAQRLEIHHTPKHGSWLNIAEIELSALTRQCLDRRIDDLDVLNTELAAWQTATNADQRQVNWQFTTNDCAAVYLKRAQSRCGCRVASHLVYGRVGRRHDSRLCHERVVDGPNRRGWDAASNTGDGLPRHPAERAQPARPGPDQQAQLRQWSALGRVVPARHHPPGLLRTRPAERRDRDQVPVDARGPWPPQNHRPKTGRGRPCSPIIGFPVAMAASAFNPRESSSPPPGAGR